MTRDDQYIKLDMLLKLKGLVDSGGIAKLVIQNGEVKVNQEVETRRGKKIRVGDVIDFAGQSFTVEGTEFS